jgi:hypothetical protein
MRNRCLTALTTRAFSIRVVLLAPTLTAVVHAQEETGPYQQLQIIAPENGSAFWSGAGDETIKVMVQPPLQEGEGHRLRGYLDQELAGEGPTLTLTNVDRGMHEVYAEIVDQAGRRLIESPRIHFTLHRPRV